MARPGLRLTPEERQRIIDERETARRNKEWWVSTRLRCPMICDKGKTMEQAAQICEVARSTVGEWIRKYRQGGLQGVRQRGPYAGKAPRLSPVQSQELREIIRGGPEAARLDTGVWTAAVVAEVVRKRFGLRLSLSQIRRTLRMLGFSIQYPRQKLSKADKDRQTTWVKVTLSEIKKSPGRTEHMMYGDEASFEQSVTLCRHWAERGVGHEVKSFPTRKNKSPLSRCDGCRPQRAFQLGRPV